MITPKKDQDFCKRNGIDHAWQYLPMKLLSLPAKSVRVCSNCGKKQYKPDYVEQEWTDALGEARP